MNSPPPPIRPSIEPSWYEVLKEEFEMDYFHKLKEFLVKEKESGFTIYPRGSDIFNAFKFTPFNEVKVVIIGQDPYHGHGQAHGLCFSVQTGIPQPPSLKNIFLEIKNDLGFAPPSNGNLEKWAQQGVLLLNSILTVRANQARSHHGQGWEEFTNAVIQCINKNKKDIVYILWGKDAQEKGSLINKEINLILKSAHPSPFSAYNGFLGCKHFSKTNNHLVKIGKTPIDWEI